MNFYNYIFATSLIFTFLHKSNSDSNSDLFYSDSGLETPSPQSIGLVFYIKINNTSDKNDYDVEITPDECCLGEEEHLDCESLQILGGCTDFIPKGKTLKLNIVAPLLNQYDRKGHCVVYIDSKSNNGQNKRDAINIKFDTAIQKYKFDSLDNFKPCEHKDEDPFNGCKPVHCDTFYNGKKPYYSRKLKRCIEVPSCVKDDNNYDSLGYNPVTNQCFEESIVKEDLAYIKNLRKNSGNGRKAKEIIIINRFQPNASEFINKEVLIDDVEVSRFRKLNKTHPLKVTKKPCKKIGSLKLFLKKYFIDNKWALMVLVLVVTVQCFLICTMFYCLSKTCRCCEDKKLIRKFFNYRQDASVTTPLIATSNINTETTEYQYLTESSNNIDKKIKCYKACQKEKNNNIQKSLSDDILSKCLNRRDWKKFKPEATTEPESNIQSVKNIMDNTQSNNFSKTEDKQMCSETKVMFEDEKASFVDIKKSKIVKVMSDAENINIDNEVDENLSSEKEIKCHSYNRYDVSGYRANIPKTTGIFKGVKLKKGTHSNSTEKGAQAYFSNDSIDDFLSERGVIYLAGENMSKYTFSSGSNNMKPSISSSVSSKTSKNFVKNVLSLLHKKSKQGPSSDPGQNKDLDVELIHMSRASIYSSTNDSDNNNIIKPIKRKDSRTSF